MKRSMWTGLVALALAGCGAGCGPEWDGTFEVVSPVTGFTVNLADDLSPDIDGVQIEAEIAATHLEEAPVTLEAIEGEILDVVSTHIENGGARVRFTIAGPVEFIATALRDGNRVESAPVSLLFDPSPRACRIVTPGNDSVLTSEDHTGDADDPFQTDVHIRCVGIDLGTPVSLRVNDGIAVHAALGAKGVAVFEAVELAEGANHLQVVAVQNDEKAEDSASITVQTDACRLLISPPSGTVFNARGEGEHFLVRADREPGSPMDARIAVEHSCPGATIELRLTAHSPATPGEPGNGEVDGKDGDGEEPLEDEEEPDESSDPEPDTGPDADPAEDSDADSDSEDDSGADSDSDADLDSEGEGTDEVEETESGEETVLASAVAEDSPAAFSVTLPDGEFTIRAVAIANPGDFDEERIGTSPRVRWNVDSVVPTARIVEPTHGSVLTRADDISDIPGLQGLVRGEFSGIDPGTPFELVVDPDSLEERVVDGTVGEDGSFEVELTLANGPATLQVRATRPSGTTAVSPPIEVTVLHTNAEIVIDSPQDGDVFNLLDDASEEPGHQILFQLSGLNLAGEPGEVACNGLRAPFTLDSNGTAVALLTVPNAPCGGVTLVCTARAETDVGSVVSEAHSLFVDPTPPGVTLLAPPEDAVFATPLATFELVTDCVGEEQRASILVDDEILAGRLVEDGAAVLGPVTVPDGVFEAVVEVTDAAGNVTTIRRSLEVDTVVPVVEFVDPPAGGLVVFGPDEDENGDLDDGFQRTIAVAVDNEVPGIAVELRIGDRPPLVTGTVEEAGRRLARFAAVTLPEGDTVLRACAGDAAGHVGCSEQMIRVVTGRPSCELVVPADGLILGRRDLPAEGGPVSVGPEVQTSMPDGVEVALTIQSPNGSTETLSVAASAGVATFDVVPLPDEGEWTFTASCLLHPLPGQSLANQVLVDVTAPIAEIVEPEENAIFNLDSVDASVEPGFHIAVEVASDDLSSGVVAYLSSDCGEGTVEHGPRDVDGTARFIVSVPDDATCVLVASLEDAVGNRGDEVTRSIRVDRIAPALDILYPLADSIFGDTDDADPDTPGFQLASVIADVDGARDTDPATLWVNGVEITGGAVQGDGTVEWSQITLMEGVNDLEVTAYDDAGNSSTLNRQVTVDTNPPEVTIISHVSGITLNIGADVEPATPGLQQDIRLAGTGLDPGTIIRVCSPQGETEPSNPSGDLCSSGDPLLARAVLSTGVPGISRVTLPEGLITFHVEAENAFGNVGTSQSVTLTVDSVPPEISELVLIQMVEGQEVVLSTGGGQAIFGGGDDSDPDQPGFQTRLKATLEGIEPGNPGDPWRMVSFVTTSPVPGTVIGSVILDGNDQAVLDTTLVDGGHRIHVEARDRANNPSSTPDAPLQGWPTTTLNFAIDTEPPSVVIVSPSGGTFLARRADGSSDDADPLMPGMQIDVEVDTSAPAGSVVEVLIDGIVASTGQVQEHGTRTTVRITVPDGTRELTSRVTTPGNNVGLSQPVTIFVDGAPPRLTIHRPSANTVFSEANGDDADPATLGFQIAMEVSYADVDPGQPISIHSDETGTHFSSTVPPSPELACPHDANRFCINVTVPGGIQTLYAKARDASGNYGESARMPVDIQLDSPSVWFVRDDSPLRFGLDSVENGSCVTDLDLRSTGVGGIVELFIDGISAGTVPVSGSGEAVWTGLTIPGGSSPMLQLRAEAGGKEGWSSIRQAICDTSEPSVLFVSPSAPTPPDDAVLYVAHGNPGDVPNAIADKLPTPELEADFTLNIVGAVEGILELHSDRDGLLLSREITASGQMILSNVVIPSSGAHTLSAVVRSVVGNSRTAELPIRVDVIPPGPVNLPPHPTIVDGRLSILELSFIAPGADQTSGDTVSGYLVRHSPAPINSQAAWEAATPITATFDSLVAPGAVQTLTVEGLPFEAIHHLAVRAVDPVGNLSPLALNSSADLMLSREHLDAPSSGTFVQVRMAVGDLDADGYDDLVVSSSVADGGEGAVYIYYGGPSNPGAPTILKGTRNSANDHISGRFGSSLAVGDVNGDGVSDLIVGAEWEPIEPDDTSTREGAIHIFFGRPNSRFSQSSTADARIHGPPNTTALAGIGPQVTVTPDLSGDGIDDLIIGSNFENGRRGRVHIVEGRSDWPATLVTSTHDANQQNVQLVNALAVLYTDWPFDFSLTNGPSFGNRLAVLGDLDGDGYGDFAIGASGGTFPAGESESRPVYVVSGRLARGLIAAETISTILLAPIPRSQFGLDLAAGDWTGDGVRDLAVVEASGARLYNGATLAQALPTTVQNPPVPSGIFQFTSLQFSGPTSAPAVLTNLGDVNGDGIDDIAASQVGPTAPGNEVLIWFGRTSGGPWGAWDVLISGKDQPNFGVGARAGWLTGSTHRDIAVLDLDSQVTVLRGP